MTPTCLSRLSRGSGKIASIFLRAVGTELPQLGDVVRVSGHARDVRLGTKVIRKLKSGRYRLYSRRKDPKTGKRRNLGTFGTREAAEHHERSVQYFKRVGRR